MGLIIALWKIDVLKTSIFVLGTSRKNIGMFGLEYKTIQDGCRTRVLCSPRFTVMTSFCLPSGFLSSRRTIDCKHAYMYTSYGKDTTNKSHTISLPSFLSFAWLTISASWLETNVSPRSTAL